MSLMVFKVLTENVIWPLETLPAKNRFSVPSPTVTSNKQSVDIAAILSHAVLLQLFRKLDYTATEDH